MPPHPYEISENQLRDILNISRDELANLIKRGVIRGWPDSTGARFFSIDEVKSAKKHLEQCTTA